MTKVKKEVVKRVTLSEEGLIDKIRDYKARYLLEKVLSKELAEVRKQLAEQQEYFDDEVKVTDELEYQLTKETIEILKQQKNNIVEMLKLTKEVNDDQY